MIVNIRNIDDVANTKDSSDAVEPDEYCKERNPRFVIAVDLSHMGIAARPRSQQGKEDLS